MELQAFDDIRHINVYHQEYRRARELAKILDYKDFGNFENVITKAKTACKNSLQSIGDHFGDITEVVNVGWGATAKYPSYELSRYACYLIAMEADSKKQTVALAKTYFALQTRKQELQDQSMEDQQRVYLRNDIKRHNKNLASTANKAGVNNYANFTDAGYIGLYGWMRQTDIHKHKKLKKDEKRSKKSEVLCQKNYHQ